MDYSKPPTSINHKEYAARLAKKTASLLNGVQYHDWVPLDATEHIQPFERRRPNEARLAWAQEKIKAMEDRALPKDRPEVYAREAVILDQEPKRDVPLQALRIGDVGITAIPCEVYGITGLKLARRSPFAIQMTVELANGGEGYIPPPELYPFGGYNTWPARSAALVPSAETEIVDISLSLLEKLAGKERKSPAPIETAYSKAVLADKPLAYWRMNNLDGTECPDATPGNKRPGTYRSCTAYGLEGPPFVTENGERRVVPSVHFAGGSVDTIVEGLPGNYTFETWIWNGLPSDNRAVTGYIFSRGKQASRAMIGDHVGIGGTYNNGFAQNRLIFYTGDENGELLVGKTEIPLKEWVYVVVTRNGDKVSLYIDGRLDVEGEIRLTDSASEPFITIGNRCDRFSGFEGKMTETALYDRVLSSGEIQKHWLAAGSASDR